MRGLAITARAAAAAVLITLVGGVADAPAVTVTIGPPTLTATASSFGCFVMGPCDNMGSQATHPDSSVRVAAPGDGVITVWRALGGQSPTGALRFRVLRPVGGGKVSGVGTSGAPVDLSGASNPTNLPVQVGDRIAIEATDNNPFAENTFVDLDPSAGTFDGWPGFADGAPPQAPAGSTTGILQLNADEQLAAPVVSAISPANGPTAGGTTVTITGDHLANASAVTFGSTAGSIVSNTNTEVVATAPPEAAGAVDVRVTTIGGTSATSSADRYTYVAPVPPPRIATVSSLSESNSVFAVGPAATPLTGLTAAARRHPRGTTFSFVLDQAAQVTVTIGRATKGRVVRGTCRRQAPRVRSGRKCVLFPTVGKLQRSAHAGHNSIPFTGRIGRKALKPGKYRATFTAADVAGTSPVAILAFKIVPR